MVPISYASKLLIKFPLLNDNYNKRNEKKVQLSISNYRRKKIKLFLLLVMVAMEGCFYHPWMIQMLVNS